jgi:hypothetical protein
MEIIQHEYDRFVRIPNETVDDSDHLDIPALGLLNVFLRHRSGWDITLERIGKKYGHGRKAMATMMGTLQVARYVVKLRVQNSENGQWGTKLIVSGVSLDWADIDAHIDDLLDRRSIKNVQYIDPTGAAVERDANRTPGRKRNASSQVTADKHLMEQSAPTNPSPDCSVRGQSGLTCDDDTNEQVAAECVLQGQSDKGAPLKKTVPEGVHAPSGEDSLSQKTARGTSAGEGAPPAERDAASPDKLRRFSPSKGAGASRSRRGASSRKAAAGAGQSRGGSSSERLLPSAAGAPGESPVQEWGTKAASSAADGRRLAAERAADAWVEARVAKGAVVPPAARKRVLVNSLAALKEHSEEVVVAACRDMASRDGRFKDPLRHLEHFSPKVSGLRGGGRKWCQNHRCRRCEGTGFVESEALPGKIPPRCYGEELAS